ncbi:MAG: dimethylmenaquinone methyltransferase [Alsobacter sp.]
MSVTRHRTDMAPVDPRLLERWRRIPVSVAVDLAPEHQIDPLVRPLRPAGQQPALFGRAVTVRCAPPDFGAVVQVLGLVQAGEVLVIDAGGSAACAMIGDVLGGHLHARGVAGIVCDGAVRDVGELAGMAGFSVFARHVNPKGPRSAADGEIGAPVSIGGRPVAPGDLIIGDDDGLAALPPDALALHIEAAEAKLALEAVWRARLAAGDTVSDIFGLP